MLSEKTGVGASWWNGPVERSISDRTAGQNDRTERFLSSCSPVRAAGRFIRYENCTRKEMSRFCWSCHRREASGLHFICGISHFRWLPCSIWYWNICVAFIQIYSQCLAAIRKSSSFPEVVLHDVDVPLQWEKIHTSVQFQKGLQASTPKYH